MIMSAVALLATASCSSNDDVIAEQAEEVSVTLNYSLFESGNMARSGETEYQQFYDAHIKTKELTPTQYSLSFISGAKLPMKVTGTWGEKDAVKLLEGEYTVTGTSAPTDRYISNTAYLKFNESVAITKDTENITLNADYDCFLLMFSTTNISSATWKFDTIMSGTDLGCVDNVYYMFVNQDKNGENRDLIVTLNRPNGAVVTLNITSLSLQKGKYYYFNDVTNSFDIDPMESGN